MILFRIMMPGMSFENIKNTCNFNFMKPIFIFLTGIVLSFNTVGQNKLTEKDSLEIISLLNKQTEAWNEGNLEKFMETYRHSGKLVFVGSNGPAYGWQATLDNYKKRYPDKKTMGHLRFKIIDVSKIDKKTAFVIGRFELTRDAGALNGYFTLVVQKKNGRWLIVSDHSCAEG